jgi:hypothetical protein
MRWPWTAGPPSATTQPRYRARRRRSARHRKRVPAPDRRGPAGPARRRSRCGTRPGGRVDGRAGPRSTRNHDRDRLPAAGSCRPSDGRWRDRCSRTDGRRESNQSWLLFHTYLRLLRDSRNSRLSTSASAQPEHVHDRGSRLMATPISRVRPGTEHLAARRVPAVARGEPTSPSGKQGRERQDSSVAPDPHRLLRGGTIHSGWLGGTLGDGPVPEQGGSRRYDASYRRLPHLLK